MFKTDGSVHTSGIKNELNTIDFLNETGLFAEEVKHFGGTKSKADAKAGDVNISIKHKKGLKNGSFDWVNTSKIDGLVDTKEFEDFILLTKLYRDTDQAEKQVENFRQYFASHCNNQLNAIKSDALTTWLKQVMLEDNHGMVMVINDTQAKQVHIVKEEHLKTVQLLKKGWTAEFQRDWKGQSSRKVILRSAITGAIMDTGLRLRLTSNNGIKAFLGLSKANKNSQVVLKLQQDGISNLIDTAEQVKQFDY